MRSRAFLSALTSPFILLAACADPATAPPSTTADIAPEMASIAASGAWTVRAPMPQPRTDLAAVTVDGAGGSLFYEIGGINQNGAISTAAAAYDRTANTWHAVAPLPTRIYHTNGAGVIGGKIYVPGGLTIRREVLAQLQVYDPATNTWTTRASMPQPGFDGVSAVIGDRLYVLTSCGAGGDCALSFDRALYRYTPATDGWVKLKSPPHPHRQAVAGVIGGRLYVAGDNAGGGRTLDVYDPASNTWTSKAQLPRSRWAAGGATLDGKLYLIGGFAGQPGATAAVATTSVYDPGTNAWTQAAALPSPRSGVAAARVGAGTAARIELVGGGPGDNHAEFQPAIAAQSQWDTIPFPASFTAEIGVRTGKSIWGSSPSDLFVVGTAQNPTRGAIIHWNGTGWTEQASIPDTGLVSVGGSSSGGVFAISPTAILRYDGAHWSRVAGPAPASTLVHYGGLWTAPTGLAFLAGSMTPGDLMKALLARNSGNGWSTMGTSGFGDGFAQLTDLSGSSAADVWSIGFIEKCDDCNGTIAVVAQRQGPSWSVAFNQANVEYRGVAALGKSDVWAVGEDSEGDALVVHFNGTTWSPAAPLSTPEFGLNDAWGSSGSDVYAVGPGGLLHFDGGSWSKIAGIKGDRVWGPSRSDVFVVQATQLVHGRP